MARVTVEDCLKHVNNRFDLVLTAAEIAHNIQLGLKDPLVPVDNDKPTVIALREIAEGLHDKNAINIEQEPTPEEAISNELILMSDDNAILEGEAVFTSAPQPAPNIESDEAKSEKTDTSTDD